MITAPKSMRVLFLLPRLIYLVLAAAFVAVALSKIGVRYVFNANEGWNAFWAVAAWDGADLYPPPESLKLNNYLPLWFYATGALGRLTGDNILAGRMLASAALLLNAGVIALIAREISGNARGCWLAGAAFLVLSGIFYADYVAVDDPQLAANLVMTLAILAFLRRIDRPPGRGGDFLVVGLLLLGGLLKHSAVAAPVAMAIFLLLHRRAAFVPFALRCAVGLAIVCAGLHALYGRAVFSSVLFSRPYGLEVAVSQALEQLARYNLLLLPVAFLARSNDAKTRFVFVYAIVAFLQGIVFSGGFDVDVNVFIDFAAAVAIAFGLMQEVVRQAIRDSLGGRRAWIWLAGWLGIALLPPLASAEAGFEEVRQVFEAVADKPQEADLVYLKAAQGPVLCQNLALCYWAGQGFAVDSNNLKTLVLAKPDLERAFVARIESCGYALLQLNDDWDEEEESDAPFTEDIVAALTQHSRPVNETDSAYYRAPADCAP